MHSSEAMAKRRAEKRERDEAPFAVGVVECVRSNSQGVQVQGSCLKKLRSVRMWIARDLLHVSCPVQRKGDVGELVLKRAAAEAIGFPDT